MPPRARLTRFFGPATKLLLFGIPTTVVWILICSEQEQEQEQNLAFVEKVTTDLPYRGGEGISPEIISSLARNSNAELG